MAKCFFCDIQEKKDEKIILENKYFFSRYDDFPINSGHCEIIPKKHIVSFFELTQEQVLSFFELMIKTKEVIQKKFHPDGYNLGINEGEAAGQTQSHLHIHLIPRYVGDVTNPCGGVRNIFPKEADYLHKMKKIPSRKDYIIYNKLVRDKIPEIIRQKGKTPIIHKANGQEYWQKLKGKLNEEVNEFLKNSTEEELADILEVLNTIIDFKKIDKEKLESLRKRKVKQRGGFKDKIILEETR